MWSSLASLVVPWTIGIGHLVDDIVPTLGTTNDLVSKDGCFSPTLGTLVTRTIHDSLLLRRRLIGSPVTITTDVEVRGHRRDRRESYANR